MRRMYTQKQLNEIVSTYLATADVKVGSLDASGLITGGEIIEKMSGYAMILGTPTNVTLVPVYGGICKNGNKLTLAFAANFTRTGTAGVPIVCNITIPENIGSKIQVGVGSNTVARTMVYCVDAEGPIENDKQVPCGVIKYNNTSLGLVVYQTDSILTANKDYYIRIEFTFLLSDNLLA